MSKRTTRRSRARPGLVIPLALLGSALAVLGVVLVSNAVSAASPLAGRSLAVHEDSAAARASTASPEYAADFEVLASTPTAIWLEPEEHSTARVSSFVSRIAIEADAASEVAVFVVYGIPGRDCGNESQGGLDREAYPAWVRAIADGVDGTRSIVVLEPDSLALSNECGTTSDRVSLVKQAGEQFADTDALVYLDGGHSSWRSVDDMASLLDEAGVAELRGFATNVSNYNTTADERSYADDLSARLGGAHYVVDASRNGSGSNGEWCNPSGRSIGAPPAIDDSGSVHDADLWIKAPGESDGECNGGPPAGEWWNEGALELLGRR